MQAAQTGPGGMLRPRARWSHGKHTCRHTQTPLHPLYLWDLQVVELLLPFENGLQSAQPDVNVAHEDTPANMDSQTVQCRAQVMQQLLDQPRIVVVL